MQILFIGDVVGKSGCRYLERTLPELRRQYGADVTIVNGENSAPGNGITAASASRFSSAERISSPPGTTPFSAGTALPSLSAGMCFDRQITRRAARGTGWRSWIWDGAGWRC